MKKYFIIGIFIVVGILVFANYQKIFKSVIPPAPEIISSMADGTSSTLFNYSIKVKGSVTNKGGDGIVVVEATVFQSGRSWTKTLQLNLESYKTENFELVFDEVKLLGTNPEYNVTTYALGDMTKI